MVGEREVPTREKKTTPKERGTFKQFNQECGTKSKRGG